MTSQISELNKKQMRIALVGVRPADQITLKGYLRVLLRLDVELAWVPATEAAVDLFMINSEFRSAASVTKLLEMHRGTPVLYINRNDNGDGSITQNLLTLPLKQINLLSDWLMRNVAVLADSTSLKSTPTQSSTPTPSATATSIKPSQPITHSTTQHTSTNTSNISPQLIELIKNIQERPPQVCELLQDGQVIGVINLNRQRIWTQKNIDNINSLDLRPYHGQLPKATYAKDANEWLWQQAWAHSETLSALIGNTAPHQLRYWVKPLMNNRRDLLQVMTAIESQALSAVEIANKAGISVHAAKRVLASLLFAGNLTSSSYQNIAVQRQVSQNPANHNTAQHSTTPHSTTQAPVQQPAQSTTQSTPQAPATPPANSEQQEKLGFLARLRRKLGL